MSTTTDGRSARWEAHRQERRSELVESAIRTIRARGAAVGMDDIASAAGTSKTVFYRHFSDRHGLYLAVAERVDDLILRDVGKVVGERLHGSGSRALASIDTAPRSIIHAAIAAYLHLVERDPEVYRFIVSAPIVGSDRTGRGDAAQTAADVTGRMALQMSELISQALVEVGNDPAPARVWGLALVGMVRAAADAWLGGLLADVTREELTDQLAELAWGGVSTAWSAPS